MGFFSNILLVIVSTFNPLFGIIGSVIQYITSDAKNAGKTFLLHLASSILQLPDIASNFIKDITSGMISDAIEASSTDYAANKTVPINSLVLKCDICDSFTNQYVKSDNLIRCKKCFVKKLDKVINHNDKIYLLKNGIFRLHNELSSKKIECKLNRSYTNKHFSNKQFPYISEKFKKF